MPAPRPRAVRLTDADRELARTLGRAQEQRARARRLQHNIPLGGDDDGERNHILGAGGEIGVCHRLGIPVSVLSIDRWSDGDIGPLQVRATRTRHLRVHPEDSDDQPYVLATATDALQWVIIVGWLWGRECKHERWWGNPYGRGPAWYAYFVPPSDLRDIAELEVMPEVLALRAPVEHAPEQGQIAFPW